MKLETAAIYNISAISSTRKKARRRQKMDANLKEARELLNLPNATLGGVYLHIIRGTGKPERKTNKAKHGAIARWLKTQKKGIGFYESQAWRELRYEALKKYGRRCSCCGAKPPDTVLHVDHIKPRSKRPELELDINNLQIMCADCNLGKSNIDSIDYR